MKIAIMGYAGSGKTCLAKYLSEKFHIPVMHLDEVKYTREWKPIDDSRVLPKVARFLENEHWIIDGNYTYLFQKERLDAADHILLMLLPLLMSPVPGITGAIVGLVGCVAGLTWQRQKTTKRRHGHGKK